MRRLAGRILNKEIWFLRLAVSLPILWAGVRSILNPGDWLGFVPPVVEEFIDPGTFLVAQAFLWIIAAAGLLAGFWRSFFAAIVTLSFIGILIFSGVDDITFRDVGLSIVAFVLFLKELRE
jgi:hypothetical protein